MTALTVYVHLWTFLDPSIQVFKSANEAALRTGDSHLEPRHLRSTAVQPLASNDI